jgi:hypothetical protein
MLDDVHRLGRREFYHLTAQGKLGMLKWVAAGGTLLHFVLDGLGGRLLSTSGTVLVFSSFATWLLVGFIFGLRSIGLDERGWFAAVLVQFCLQLSNHSQCLGKLCFEACYLGT